MAYERELSRAIAEASVFFKDKFDKAGKPYILHKLRVMQGVIHFGNDYAILGVYHDVVEDCFKGRFQEGLDHFRTVVCGEDSLIDDLSLLTHDPKHTYSEYIRSIKRSARATEVKKMDLRDNSDILRLKGLTAKDLERVRKYHASFLYLSDQHDKLLEALG